MNGLVKHRRRPDKDYGIQPESEDQRDEAGKEISVELEHPGSMLVGTAAGSSCALPDLPPHAIFGVFPGATRCERVDERALLSAVWSR